MHRLRLPAVLLLSVLAGAALAADWPQWRGPDRTGIAREKGLLKTWPKAGPRLLWTHEQTGIGYSGPAVVGDRLYITGGDERTESLYAIDVKTGKRVWAAPLGSFYRNSWGGGPRGTPTVVGEHVYVIGGQGVLLCARADNGKTVWSKDLVRDLGGRVPRWGYSESPLIDGDRLICTPGGRNGTLAALERTTGKPLWRSTDVTEGAEYSSVIAADHAGKRQYIQLTEGKLFGVEAATGKRLWEVDWPGQIATIPTPIYHAGHVYATSGYGTGCKLIRLDNANRPTEVYANRTMVNQHGGVILLDGHVYGYHDSRGWVCQELKTGKAVWTSRKLGKGSIVYADGCFFCYAEADGTLAVIAASSTGWDEKARFKIPRESKIDRPPNRPDANFWAHPVVANGRLYLRDQELLFCYDVAKDPGGR